METDTIQDLKCIIDTIRTSNINHSRKIRAISEVRRMIFDPAFWEQVNHCSKHKAVPGCMFDWEYTNSGYIFWSELQQEVFGEYW